MTISVLHLKDYEYGLLSVPMFFHYEQWWTIKKHITQWKKDTEKGYSSIYSVTDGSNSDYINGK